MFTNPRYANEVGGILLDYETSEGSLYLDSGDLYDRAVSGEFGEVSPFTSGPFQPTPSDVDRERDRRIDGGFTFNGTRFQTRPQDRDNIAGASTAALAAIVSGAQPGDLRWADPDSDFVWIAEDNTTVAMDAQTTLAFGQAAMQYKSALIFAARALKDLNPIPTDYQDDSYWPAS